MWNEPRTWTAGETVTAAILNSAVRDNLAQTVMGTTATAIAVGSMGYVSSTGVLGRVLIGTAYQGLLVNSSTTAPEWGNVLLSTQSAGLKMQYANSGAVGVDANGLATATVAWPTAFANCYAAGIHVVRNAGNGLVNAAADNTAGTIATGGITVRLKESGGSTSSITVYAIGIGN